MLIQRSIKNALMINDILSKSEIIEYLDREEIEEDFTEYLEKTPISTIIDYWNILNNNLSLKLFDSLSLEKRSSLINNMNCYDQEWLASLSPTNEKIKEAIIFMPPDDLVDLIQAVSPYTQKLISSFLDVQTSAISNYLLSFDENSAGSLMTPIYTSIKSNSTVREVIKYFRTNKSLNNVENMYYIYILNNNRELLGIITMKSLLLANEDNLVEEIMENNIISVNVNEDKQNACNLLEKNQLIKIPVIDDNNKMLGTISFDDVMNVIRENKTSDLYKIQGIAGNNTSFLESPIIHLIKKRLPWLIILLIVGTVTSNVIHYFDNIITTLTFTAFFIPVITQTGGNVASQSATLLIRDLHNQIYYHQIIVMFLKEIAIGSILALASGVILFLRAYYLSPHLNYSQSLILALSLIIVVFYSSIMGLIIPIILKSIKIDPAVSAGPVMSTIIDITGLFIYFRIVSFI